VSYFERPFADMVKEFGLERTADAWRAVHDSWSLLDEMYTDAHLSVPLARFTGHAGFSSKEQVLGLLEDLRLKKQAGMAFEELLIADHASFLNDIPEQYHSLYRKVAHPEVLSRLETTNETFIAVLSDQKGVTNSALLCQEMVHFLEKKYSSRFELHQYTPMKKMILKTNHALVDVGEATITTTRVVLCTNGFENFHIINEDGLSIDTRFHHNIKGYVGYMTGYLEKYDKPPIAISYFTDPDATIEDPYFYLTRRQYEYEKGLQHNLVCVGGPVVTLADREKYYAHYDYPEQIVGDIDVFVKGLHTKAPHVAAAAKHRFAWHGLMGYTRNRVRLVGVEPKNPVLLYNLGCNGVGILPSLFGGRRTARLLAGEAVPAMIFDPQ
jgi:glycine/D-amino acid oxidase-like deaminating enzyme